MTGSIELDPDRKHLCIRFPYNPHLVAEVKELPGRRWDAAGKTWRVPAEHVDVVLTQLMKHGFAVAPEVSGLLASGPAKAAAPKPRSTAPAAAPGGDALTISALNQRIRDAVGKAFPEPIWVVGEVLDFDKQKNRQHFFFALVEKRAGEDKVAAQAAVALFATTASRLLEKLATAPEPLTLRDGIEIRARVRVDFYAPSGRLQLVIEDIDPAFTLGKLALTREAILRELRELGIAEQNRAKPLPVPPLRVGVLASLDSDGWNDFLKELETSGIGFAVTAYAVKVQGEELRPTVLSGLAWFAREAAAHDVLCIIRGGGSRTDLAWFDDREVALAVARHPLKILCGIGHQRDQSVLDLIAHSEKTPTAVAGYLVRAVQDEVLALDARGRRLCAEAKDAVHAAERRLTLAAQELRRRTETRLGLEQRTFVEARRRLTWGTQALLRRRTEQLLHAHDRLRAASALRLEREQQRLANAQTRQRLLDPATILMRGYTLVRDQQGRIVTRARSLAPGARIAVRFRDGVVHARAEQIEPEPEA